MKTTSPSLGLWLTALIGLAVLGGAIIRHARGDGVAQVMTSKSLTQATVDVIDPESGTSTGTGGADVRIAVGDIISFRFKFTPVPDKINRGLQGYLTEYLPPNTEVVGVRITDAAGNTILPRYPGLAVDGCTGGARCNSASNLPCSSGTCSFPTGSIAQVHGDTGVFFSVDPRTARTPAGSFITMDNGIVMSPQPSTISPGIVSLLGDTSGPYHAHNPWDWAQVRAYGISTAVAAPGGDGTTPYLYGSPVAGPDTFYRHEASTGGTGNLLFDNVDGPWERIRYPGSTIAFGAGNMGTSGTVTRNVIDTDLGYDLTPATAVDANAVRVALGETRTGEPGFVEVALRVTGVPLDPGFLPAGGNINCGEVFGSDTSSRGGNSGALDNPWPTYVGSPACVFLRLLFDLEVDRALAVGADDLTYTLRGSNLSVNPETNVVVRMQYDQSRQTLLTATPTPTSVATCPDNTALQCINWSLGTLAPGADYTMTVVMDVGGGGQTTNVMLANYRSDQLPAPGFTTQALTIVTGIAVPRVTLAPAFDPTTTFAPQGGTAAVTGIVTNVGTQIWSQSSLTLVLPPGWSVNGAVTLGGSTLSCTAGCGTARPTYNAPFTYTPFQQRALAFTVDVPAGASGQTGLYRLDASTWGGQSGFGGDFETYFARAAFIPVNQRRTERPTVTCPIGSTSPSISGTAETDAALSVRFNLLERGTATASNAATPAPWTSSNFGAFGELYGGLEVTAVATAPGELPSEPSLPCFVTTQRECSDGLDNDGDGFVDHPDDPGCRVASSPSETPECDDGLDNDGDGDIDTADSGCVDPSDTSERLDCNDGFDNDGDGLVDFPADPDCISPADASEDPACFDFVDNDGDGLTDYPAAYPRCRSLDDPAEAPECSDALDDDGDGFSDHPDDVDCPGPLFDVEAPTQVSIGDLLVVDRGQAALFVIDPATGAEQIVSQGAQLAEPEGLVQRADGRLVLSSPSGLFEISLVTGRQTRRSDPFVSAGGIPLAVDSAGNPVALDTAGIHRIAWNPDGSGITTTLLTAPVGGNPGSLQIFTGFTLVLEDDDTALVTGFGLLGDGVFRAELSPPSVAKVTPGFLGHAWRDLALEAPGTLVAVGRHASLGEGVFRIDTSDGTVTALSTDPAWVQPEGVAVAAGGDLYVVDSGSCGSSGCSGGLVAHVDPASGTRRVVRSGLFTGTLQIAVIDALPIACSDGIDDDGDGLVDLDDPGCRNASWTVENPACDNDLDDDKDGKIDWDGGSGGGTPDPQCGDMPWRKGEASSGCGLGAELAFVVPLLAWLRRRR